jgi:hypothetical protein
MPLATVRLESASRFREAQSFLSEIKVLERSQPTQTAELNTRKGLFLVLLYGAFEYSMTRSIIEMIALFNAANLQYEHCNHLLYPLALDPELTSIAAVGRDSKWSKRADLFKRQKSSNPIVFVEGDLLRQMENIWAKTIKKMFDILGVACAELYDHRVRQYIDEVVDKRNAVAHGRESAAAIGQSYTTAMLHNLHDELVRQSQYVFLSFEEHLFNKTFIQADFQHHY